MNWNDKLMCERETGNGEQVKWLRLNDREYGKLGPTINTSTEHETEKLQTDWQGVWHSNILYLELNNAYEVRVQTAIFNLRVLTFILVNLCRNYIPFSHGVQWSGRYGQKALNSGHLVSHSLRDTVAEVAFTHVTLLTSFDRNWRGWEGIHSDTFLNFLR